MSTGAKLRIKIFIAGILLLAIISPLVSQAVPVGGGYDAPVSSVVGNFWDMGKRIGQRAISPGLNVFLDTTSFLHNHGFNWIPDLSIGSSWQEGSKNIKLAAIQTGGSPVKELAGKNITEEDALKYYEMTQDDSCSLVNIGGCLRMGLAAIGQGLTLAFGSLLVGAGTVLDISIKVSILSVKDWLINSGINSAWRTLRDLGNIFFVFILLYVAIGTVFELKGLGDPKKLIVNVIIVALLVNFSGFFTRVVIDATNIIAYEFYSQMGGGLATGGNKLGIGGQLVSRLNLTQQYLGEVSVPLKATDAEGNTITVMAPVIGSLSMAGIIIQTFGNIIIVLVACFVLIAMSIMFLIRTVYLLFLYVMAPIAFISYAIPDGKYNYLDAWIKKLVNQALIAPALLIPLYVVFIFLKDGIGGLLGKDTASVSSMGPMVLVFMNFLVIGLLFGCIMIANNLGAVGANKAKSWGRTLGFGALSMAGGYTIGNAASRIAKSQRMQAWASSANPITGRVAMGARLALGSIANSGFGTGTKGYQSRVETRQKNQQQRAASFTGPQASQQRASYMSRLISSKDRDAYFRSLSTEDKATTIEQLATQDNKKEVNRLLAGGSGRIAREITATTWKGIDPGDTNKKKKYLESLDENQFNNLYEGLDARGKADLEAFAKKQNDDSGTAGPLEAKTIVARRAFEQNNRTSTTTKGEAIKERNRVERIEKATAVLSTRIEANDTDKINTLRDLAAPEFKEFAINNNLFDGTHNDTYPHLTTEQLKCILDPNALGLPYARRQEIKNALNNAWARRNQSIPGVVIGQPRDEALEKAHKYLNDPLLGGNVF